MPEQITDFTLLENAWPIQKKKSSKREKLNLQNEVIGIAKAHNK